MEAINSSATEVETIPLESVTQVLRLSKLQIKSVLASVNSTAKTVSKQVAAHLIFADLLENLKFLSAEARALILQQVWATKLNPPPDAPCCAGDQVFFADSRYCTWLGYTGWLDLETGDNISLLPCEPVETIAYNLIALRRQAYAVIDSRSEKNVKQNARSMEESGHVRVRAADAVSG